LTTDTGELAAVFSALGDATRVALLDHLVRTGPGTATNLATITDISRQAVDRHLRVLQSAGLLESERTGREVLYRHKPGTAESAADWLSELDRAWEEQLNMVKAAAEQ
jgi:DNA-binding transcriptional ArsR family regulator